MTGYVVDIKPSARRANAAVGRFVRDSGGRREFDDRTAADEWAGSLTDGDDHVWVRDANPNDGEDVDGYLVSRHPVRADPGEQPGEQSPLGEFDPTLRRSGDERAAGERTPF